MKNRDLIMAILLSSVILLIFAVNPAFSEEQLIESQRAYIQPDGIVQLEWLAEPPVMTKEKQAYLKSMEDKVNLPGPPLPVSAAPIAGPTPGTGMLEPGVSNGAGPSSSVAPTLFRTVDLDSFGVIPGGYKSVRLEPAAANIGKYVFYTGNWFAARSSNQGVSWTYVNPFADFSDFCCDQDVIYDKGRDLMLWLRMGSRDVNGENVFKLGVSTDGGTNFCTYTIAPTNVNTAWTNNWWDYPQLALTNNNIYMTWNMYDNSTPNPLWQRQVLLRWPLYELSTCSSFSYGYIASTTGYTWAPAQGGTTKFYWGDHVDTDTFRVYTWQETASGYSWNDINIPAWTSTPRGSASCPSPDGNNACGFLDHRVMSGYVKKHPALAFGQLETIGFFWNVQEGGGFPYPYSENAWFYNNSMAYGGRHYQWASWGAFIYPSAYPDVRGNLGISGYYSGGSYYPSFFVGKDDDTDGLPPYWGYTTVASSNAGPSTNTWGDYNRVRQFLPLGTCWLATGHVLRDGTTGAYAHPYYAIFGNTRDYNSCYLRWRQQG